MSRSVIQTKKLAPLSIAGIHLDQRYKQLEKSELFDRKFYLSYNRDVARSKQDPLMHYLRYGAREGRATHPLFDSHYYRTAASAAPPPDPEQVGENPLLHFLEEGYRQGFNPHCLFDIAYYRRQVPGLSEDENPLLHFLHVGYRRELSPHPLFDMDYYRRQISEFYDQENLLLHFLEHGNRLRLNPHPLFDVDFYLETNPDVKKGRLNPLVHFLHHGQKEGRSPHPLFDIDYYRTAVCYYTAQQVSQVIDGNFLLHFLSEGHKKGISPHPLFDIAYYRKQAEERIGDENPLVHFLEHGARLSLNPHPLFDVNFYRQSNSQISKSKFNPLVHFVRYGKSKRLSPHPFFDSRFYLSRYKDIEKSDFNPLIHFVCWGAQELRWPNADFDPEFYAGLIFPISADNPLLHYLEIEKERQLPVSEYRRVDEQGLFKTFLWTCRLIMFTVLCLLYGLIRKRMKEEMNYDHRYSIFKFWTVALSRFWQGYGAQVKFTIPVYLTQPKRFEQPQSYAQRILKAPLLFAYLYLANILKVQGFHSDAEFLFRKLSTKLPIRDLALASLGDLLLVQATWAHEFKNHEVDGIALNPFARSKIFTYSKTWHGKTFNEVLNILDQAITANDENTDAQWLLCYGQIVAGKYAAALNTLHKYPGRDSEISERNLLKARAAFGVNPSEGVSTRKQFLGEWSEKCRIAELKLINIEDVPLYAVQEHIRVIEPVELRIQSTTVRNGESILFDNTLKFGAVYLSRFNKAEVIPKYGMVIVDDKMLIRESSHVKPCHMPIFNSCLQEIVDDSAFICSPHPAAFGEENCLYIGCNDNFYHWLLEELPRLSIVEQAQLFKDAPILIDTNAYAWQYEALSLLKIDPSRLRRVNFRRPTTFKNLIMPSRLSRNNVAHPAAVSFMREKLLQGSCPNPASGKRIYIARRRGIKANRGMLNERNIIGKFKKANFRIIDTSELSIREQIALFSDADVIAGPGGSALANMLFAPKGARVLSLGSNDILCETFTSIAAAIGQESWACRGPSYPRAYPYWIWTNFDFEIDERDLDLCFDKIL